MAQADRLPTHWSASYTFFGPSQRPPLAPWVSIIYRSDDGHEGVSLSQYAVGDQPGQYNLMLRDGDWQTLTRNGVDVLVRAGSQTQAHIERDQTFVFLTLRDPHRRAARDPGRLSQRRRQSRQARADARPRS